MPLEYLTASKQQVIPLNDTKRPTAMRIDLLVRVLCELDVIDSFWANFLFKLLNVQGNTFII